ncbi:MAG: cytochrome P450 [Acidobacteria bacterium]|nr:cytochrome P450 [Acidobacteriota bacterium]
MKHTPNVSVVLSLVLFFVCAFPFAIPLRAQEPARLAASASAHDNFATARRAPTSPVSRPRKRLVPVRVSDTVEGSRVLVASDASLDDYSSYFDGGRFYVLIPKADVTAAMPDEFKGRGFASASLDQRGGDALLSFELQAGTTPRLSQKFNRLEINFTAQDAAGQTHAPVAQADERAQLQQLLKRVEELEGQVRELRANAVAADGQPPPAAPPATPTAAAATATPEEEEVQAAITGQEHETHTSGPRLQIQGFADVNFRASNGRGTTNAFGLGQLDLFITSQLSEKFSVVSELILEAKRDNSFEFEIHRLLLRYAMNDYLNLSAGRYHSGIGYYNTAFHHGSYFATAANRPFLFAFEGQGGLLPLHNVGVSATGRIPSGSLDLRYIAEVGNGRSARSAVDRTVQTAFDENNGKSYNLGLSARPDWLPGLQTGFSFYHDRLTPTAAPNVDQRIMAAHVVYQSPRYEWLNEAVFIRHKPEGAGGVAAYTPGFYTQFARRFGKAQPYFRYQYVNASGRDFLLRDIGRRNGPSFGLRYDLTTYAAFKSQYDRTARRGLSALDELILQLAFTF